MLFLAKMEEMSKKVSHFGRLTWIWSDEINSYKNTSCKKSQEQKLWYIIHEKCPRTIRPVIIQDSISVSWLNNFFIPEEIAKLQQRLSLLREEYVKLQKHCEAIEKDRAKLRAVSGAQNGDNDDSFIANILRSISSMLRNDEYR